jgi:hypothetical protein
MKKCSRHLFAAACVVLMTLTGNAQTPSVSIYPNRLREGDSKTRNVTIEVKDAARVNISVSYSADPASAAVDFIPQFVVQDNGTEDRDSQSENIRVVLPKAFARLGVYTIVVERQSFKVVHERNNSSLLRQLAEWVIGGAGNGERGGLEGPSALQRILDMNKTSRQDKLAIWSAPLPPVGERIKPESLSVRINSAITPAWSPKGNDLACSAWRDQKWVIADYTIKENGDGVELWQWNPHKDKSSDFSPAWSPNGDAVAFVRLGEDGKSDIWILELDKNLRPGKEVRVTTFGNVEGVFGWDKDLGLLFETKTDTRQVWALKPVAKPALTPLDDVYSSARGTAPLRKTLIYAEESDSPPPYSVVHERNSSNDWDLLTGMTCWYRWPTISHDEKWIALESDCTRKSKQ